MKRLILCVFCISWLAISAIAATGVSPEFKMDLNLRLFSQGNRRRLPVASHSRSGSGGRLATVGADGVRLKAIA